MPRIELETLIDAPVAACFDAARDIGLHCRLAKNTRERAVAGRISGLIGEGEWVTFSASHFGVRLQLTARITHFEAPLRFVDEQTRGPFKRLQHAHEFEPIGETRTRMRDILDFTAPFGAVGRIVAPVIAWHMQRFLKERAHALKLHLEAGAP